MRIQLNLQKLQVYNIRQGCCYRYAQNIWQCPLLLNHAHRQEHVFTTWKFKSLSLHIQYFHIGVSPNYYAKIWVSIMVHYIAYYGHYWSPANEIGLLFCNISNNSETFTCVISDRSSIMWQFN